MNFYDKLNELVRAFKETSEYKEYISLKEKIKLNQDQYLKVKEFKERQKENQVAYLNGSKLSEEKRKEMENLYSLVIRDETSRKLLEVEMKINVMLADIQKVIGESIKEIVEF